MTQVFDNKFGNIEIGNKAVIEGVGADAEVITNANGGKQSKSPAALHLVDPEFLRMWFNGDNIGIPVDPVIDEIVNFMTTGDKLHLTSAIFELNCIKNEGQPEFTALLEIGKVLMYGADRYEPNNWRLIPQEEHINHALIHYIAYKSEDTQDDHLGHCMCRLMMAFATEKTEGFDYSRYVKKNS